MDMTVEEEALLKNASTDDEWNDACLKIKNARPQGPNNKGTYPPDWYPKVLTPGGLLHQFQERAGKEMGDGITITAE